MFARDVLRIGCSVMDSARVISSSGHVPSSLIQLTASRNCVTAFDLYSRPSSHRRHSVASTIASMSAIGAGQNYMKEVIFVSYFGKLILLLYVL